MDDVMIPRKYFHVWKSLNLRKSACSSGDVIGGLHVGCILNVNTQEVDQRSSCFIGRGLLADLSERSVLFLLSPHPQGLYLPGGKMCWRS
jgi:hypothetical protein